MKVLFRDKEFRLFILNLNRFDQLEDRGIRADGRTLKEVGGNAFTASGYSPKTIEIKKEKGQSTENITLKDTGDFYKSFKLQLDDGKFLITANTLKEDTDLIKEWGEQILGLTNENVQETGNKAIAIIIPHIQSKIMEKI